MKMDVSRDGGDEKDKEEDDTRGSSTPVPPTFEAAAWGSNKPFGGGAELSDASWFNAPGASANHRRGHNYIKTGS